MTTPVRKRKRPYVKPEPPLPLPERMQMLRDANREGQLDRIARDHGTTTLEVMGRSRVEGVVAARYDFAAALRADGWSHPRIGRLIGRDHSSVMSGLAGAEKRAAKRARLAARFGFAKTSMEARAA